MYGDTAGHCEVNHTAARNWWWYGAPTLRNSEMRTGLGVFCASSSFSLRVTWMMYINQSMTRDVLAISAITIVLLFLQRQDRQLQNSHRQCCTCIRQQHIWSVQCCNHSRSTFAGAQADNKRCGFMSSITKDSSNCSILPNDLSAEVATGVDHASNHCAT